MDRRLMVLNMRIAVALFLVALLMLGSSFIWAANYLSS